MKINESKQNLDMNIVASLNAEAWNYLVTLRSQKESLGRDFKGAKKLTDALEELEEAYLIYLGQLEAILADGGIEVGETADTKEVKESLKEDLETLIINEPVINVVVNTPPESEDFEDECEPCEDEETPGTHCGDAFEFYCDFDDPTPGPAIQTPWQGIIK